MAVSEEQLEAAGCLIREGKLVAFPTETVYGLGANALDHAAVERIFQAKGRPSTSPLIVHVDSIAMARGLVLDWPDTAESLARRYWPGPLTLVLAKKPLIPDVVTAGLPTAGIRMPCHPIALALIRKAGCPIAAPSANRFTELSPTTAAHVRKGLDGAVDLILDGGPTKIGIESTVLSLAVQPPVLLRPGFVSRREIEECIGPVALAHDPVSGPHASPGMHRKHYSPRTPLVLVKGEPLPASGRGAYLWRGRAMTAAKCVAMPEDPAAYGASLYRVLHQLDDEGWDWIAVERPPDAPEWMGVNDRLRRAAAR